MRSLGSRLFCLLVAVLLWMQVASTTPVEETLPLPLQAVGLDPAVTLAGSDLPAVVDVRLRGSKLQFLAHRFLGRRPGRVDLDLAGQPVGEAITRDLSAADVKSELDVLGLVQPVRLRLQLDRERARRVRVRVATVGQLPEDRVLLRPPAAQPESVQVRGPQRLMSGWESVRTEPVDLGRLRASAEIPRRLVSPHVNLALEVEEARVLLAIGPRGERTFANVPVVPLVDARQPPASVFPPVATVVVAGAADSLSALTAARLAVTVPLTGLSEGTHHLRGQVVLPDGFTFVSLQPREFVVRLGEGSDGGGRRPSSR